MTKLLKKIIFWILGIGIVSAATIPTILPDDLPSFVVDNKTIELVYTDNNDGEDLIIHTDKATYNDFSGADVYFSIENQSKSYQLTDIQFLFPKGGKVESIATLVKDVPYQAIIDDFTDVEYDCSFYQTSTDTIIKETCISQEYTPYEETRYKDEWIEKEWFDVTSDKKVISAIEKREILYFKARISFKPRTSGEFFITANGSAGATGTLDPWYNSSWTYRRLITIDNTKVDDDLVNFPVLVAFSSSTFTFANARASGIDIRFTSSDEQTLIDYERERWASTTDGAALWVEFPTVSSSTDTLGYMYYGNSGASDVSSSTAVWDSNFAMVQHMKDDPDTSNIQDSLDVNDMAKKGANEPLEVMGKIGLGQDFDGSNDDLSKDASVSGIGGSAAFTVEAWVKRQRTGAYELIFANGPTNLSDFHFLRFESSDAIKFQSNTTAGGTVSQIVTTNTLTDQAAFHHIMAVYDGSVPTTTVHVDGTAWTGTVTATGANVGAHTTFLRIGNRYRTNGETNWIDAIIDEVRLSNSARSNAWIVASYNSGNNTLLSIGAETTETAAAAVSEMKTTIIQLQ